jgi:4-alpha-glucanotransferase
MRASGILLHPTSLPGPHGIGDLGEWAYRFADFLSAAGQGLWQVLPLAPPAVSNSPYKAYSSMAGNPLLISLDQLARSGLIPQSELDAAPQFPEGSVDFVAVTDFKWRILRQAARAFFAKAGSRDRREFEEFCAGQKFWLDQFADFAALRDQNGRRPWTQWDPEQKPDPQAVGLHKYIQFVLYRQWHALKQYCHDRGIRIIGDLPIFVAHDSADVWGNPGLFNLDERGNPRAVAGVPPDYFSATGQLWGNPLYRWDAMEESGYQWWIDRVRCMLDQFDLVRIDHFRGFEQYYEIPADAPSAEHGRWVDGPRDRFFEVLTRVFGALPFIAEDLGMITPEVLALRDRWGFPGMRVLQFAFLTDWDEDPFKPHNFIPNCVVYTGTHDNDTSLGWFQADGEETQTEEERCQERERALRYLHSDGLEIHWDFIRAALESAADTAIFPLQDALGLGSEGRMNVPSRAENNWGWRFLPQQLQPEISARLRDLSRACGRMMWTPSVDESS